MQKYQENTKNRKLWGASYNFCFFFWFLMNKQLLFEKSKNQKFYVNAVFHDGFMFFEMLLKKNAKFYINFKYNLHRNKNKKTHKTNTPKTFKKKR